MKMLRGLNRRLIGLKLSSIIITGSSRIIISNFNSKIKLKPIHSNKTTNNNNSSIKTNKDKDNNSNSNSNSSNNHNNKIILKH